MLSLLRFVASFFSLFFLEIWSSCSMMLASLILLSNSIDLPRFLHKSKLRFLCLGAARRNFWSVPLLLCNHQRSVQGHATRMIFFSGWIFAWRDCICFFCLTVRPLLGVGKRGGLSPILFLNVTFMVVVSGLQAVCHVRIMRWWSSNLEQWTIQHPRLWVPSP